MTATATTTASRTYAIVNTAKKGKDLLVRITEPARRGDPIAHYFVKAIAGDFGPVYRWESWEDTTKQPYFVDTSAMTCDCPWGRSWRPGRKACRHLACTLAMRRKGELDGTV